MHARFGRVRKVPRNLKQNIDLIIVLVKVTEQKLSRSQNKPLHVFETMYFQQAI